MFVTHQVSNIYSQLGSVFHFWFLTSIRCIFIPIILTIATEIRLAGGAGGYEGRVEVRYGGQWGTICDDNWDINDATIVCRSLGFPSSVAAKSFGPGNGIIWLDDVACTGTESDLKGCTHNGWGNHNCQHHEDAGVVCSTGKINCDYIYFYWNIYNSHLSKPSLIYYFKYNLGCTWIQKDGYYVEEGHTTVDECYDTLQEAKEKCIDSQDCHAIATQNNVCGGKYRVSHGGPTWGYSENWVNHQIRAWEHVHCRGNEHFMQNRIWLCYLLFECDLFTKICFENRFQLSPVNGMNGQSEIVQQNAASEPEPIQESNVLKNWTEEHVLANPRKLKSVWTKNVQVRKMLTRVIWKQIYLVTPCINIILI